MKDLQLNQEGDINIGADLAIDNSDRQHQEHLILIEKGSIKQEPSAGVGAATFLEAEDGAGLLREISIQFSADGMNVKKVGFNKVGQLKIDAPYK